MNEPIARKGLCPKRFHGVLCVFALGLLQTPFAFAETDAKKIMDGVYQQDTSRDTTLRAVFDVFDKEGHERQKRFVLFRLGSPGDSKTLVRFTGPPEIKGVALLSFNKRGEKDRQWLYIPATNRARSVVPRERSEKFAGTDFTYEDIADRMTDDFSCRVLSEDETMDGHRAFKIESTSRDPSTSHYKFVYYWVAQDVPCILYAEMYDQGGQKVRVLHATQLKKVSGIWGARHVEMSSVLENTKTILTIDSASFNKGLDEQLFTPDALEKSH